MEEEMEDPGEEVLLVPGGIFVCNSFIFFLAGDVFFFWFSEDFEEKFWDRKGIYSDITDIAQFFSALSCFFWPRNNVTTDESGHQPRGAGQFQ